MCLWEKRGIWIEWIHTIQQGWLSSMCLWVRTPALSHLNNGTQNPLSETALLYLMQGSYRNHETSTTCCTWFCDVLWVRQYTPQACLSVFSPVNPRQYHLPPKTGCKWQGRSGWQWDEISAVLGGSVDFLCAAWLGFRERDQENVGEKPQQYPPYSPKGEK